MIEDEVFASEVCSNIEYVATYIYKGESVSISVSEVSSISLFWGCIGLKEII